MWIRIRNTAFFIGSLPEPVSWVASFLFNGFLAKPVQGAESVLLICSL
jgi:hypothetical protein